MQRDAEIPFAERSHSSRLNSHTLGIGSHTISRGFWFRTLLIVVESTVFFTKKKKKTIVNNVQRSWPFLAVPDEQKMLVSLHLWRFMFQDFAAIAVLSFRRQNCRVNFQTDFQICWNLEFHLREFFGTLGFFGKEEFFLEKESPWKFETRKFWLS